MAERLKAAVLKTVDPFVGIRGFESPFLRQSRHDVVMLVVMEGWPSG